MRKGFLSNASAMLGVPVESWSSPVKFLFTGERHKEELAKWIEEINEENAEFMSYKKEFEVVDLNPTYQQLSQDRIDDQSAKNILMLKSFEHVLEERLFAFNKFLDSLSKTKTSFDAFQSSEGSLRQALDALFVFIEQELQQARQQLSLGDLKKDLADTKLDAARKAGEYQKEVGIAEADVVSAEKALQKTKETLRKLLIQKKRMEMGSNSSESVGAHYFRSSSSLKSPPPSPALSTSVSTSALDTPLGAGDTSPVSSPLSHSHNPPTSLTSSTPSAQDLEKNERYQENKEQLDRTQGDVRQQIRELLRLIGVRDQVLTANRRALQQLNKQCKTAISSILRKLVDREREALAARTLVVDKLDKAVEKLSTEEDEQEFIESYKVEDSGELVLCSQALSILGDIVTIDTLAKRDSEIEEATVSEERPSSTTLASNSSNNKAPTNPNVARRASTGTMPALCSMEETTMHLSKIFFLAEWPTHIISPEAAVEDILATFLGDESQNFNENENIQDTDKHLKTSIQRLVQLSDNLEGRKVLVNVLNQFRSKQVNVGIGFKLLAAVLWGLLTKCKSANDVHNGKIVMILSQTFYMLTFEDAPVPTALSSETNPDTNSSTSTSTSTSTMKEDQNEEEKDVEIQEEELEEEIDKGKEELTVTGTDTVPQIQKKKEEDEEEEEEEGEEETPGPSSTCKPSEELPPPPVLSSARACSTDSSSSSSSGPLALNAGREDGGARRKYLKELLITHSIWLDSRFWEQALWQCVLDQLVMIQMDEKWHDMEPAERKEAVRRVHDVIFSQVMAIAHSMIELGCSKSSAREFVYRMCVVHQLSERHQHELLRHLNSHSNCA